MTSRYKRGLTKEFKGFIAVHNDRSVVKKARSSADWPQTVGQKTTLL